MDCLDRLGRRDPGPGYVVHPLDAASKTVSKRTQHVFIPSEKDWGWTLFMPLAQLRDGSVDEAGFGMGGGGGGRFPMLDSRVKCKRWATPRRNW